MRAQRRLVLVLLLTVLAAVPAGGASGRTPKLAIPGLERAVHVVRDEFGIPHVYARNDHDLAFMVGYLHAQDRLFQMDQSRRQASGRLAELLGPSALATDAQLRTIGLHRAAERSLAALSRESRSQLAAYADGVNAWLDANPLPPEYAALELTRIPPWTAADSMAIVKLLAFGLSFETSDIDNTTRLLAYQAALGPAAGAALFAQDVNRAEPLAHVPSILPGESSGPIRRHRTDDWSSSHLSRSAVRAGEQAGAKLERAGVTAVPGEQGSNIFVVDGAHSASGRPMVASDPHLSLSSPPVFYELGVDVNGRDPLTLYGVTFPGTPLVVHGMNEHIAWGSTVNPTDVTDVYQEHVVVQGGVPVATVYKGQPEPLRIIPESFRVNQLNGVQDDLAPAPGMPPATFVVPRRNEGPLITAPSGTPPTALSVQFTGFSATREPDFFRLLARARTVEDARAAVRYFDFGAQNWMVVDDSGNIGYFTSGEIPLREDLQAGGVAGLPPWFIRNGTGGNEWIPDSTPAEDQASRYELLPFSEMDQLVNPRRGWIANANQDPTGQTFDNDPLNELRPGGGIRYVSPGHDYGTRNARVSRRLEEALAGGEVSFAEMQSIQADVRLHDAELLVPYLTAAMQAARTPGAPPALAALGADPAVQEAVARLAAWRFSAPTGIPEGYDASDVDGVRLAPTQAEIDASVATTIYSLWRGRMLASTIDATLASKGLAGFLPSGDRALIALRHLLQTGGVGASGIAFWSSPAERDQLLLGAVRSALSLAASPAFAPAFGQSTNQSDYRWGKLHRIVFRHPLGAAFSIPDGAGYTSLSAALPGLATDGGFGVVDASSHSARASGLNAFMFGSGPARRFVAEARRSHPRAVQVIPGGESGNPFGRWFGNQLGLWLTDDYHVATVQRGEVERDATSREVFVPG